MLPPVVEQARRPGGGSTGPGSVHPPAPTDAREEDASRRFPLKTGVHQASDALPRSGWDRFFVGEPGELDAEEARRVRSVAIALRGLIAVGVPFLVEYLTLGVKPMAWALTGALGYGVALLALLRRTRDAGLVGALANLGLYCLLLVSALTHGGFYDPDFAWLYIVPIAAVTFTTRRQAWFWTVVVSLTTVGLWWAEEHGGVVIENVVPEPLRPGIALGNRLGMIAAIGVLLSLFLRWQRRAEEEVRSAHAQLVQQEREMRRMALFDGLTGLPSRAFLERALDEHVERGEPFAILFIDLDRFKNVNDSMGHRAGDALLRQVAHRFMGVVGPCDRASVSDLEKLMRAAVITRRGGDELVVVLPGATEARARQTAEELLEALRPPFEVSGRSIYVAASLGIALAPDHGNDAATLVRAADVALYDAKKRSGSSVAVYKRRMTQSTPRTLVLEAALRSALEKEELSLAFQPLYAGGDRLSGAEALLRWRCEALDEDVSPGELVPLAETTGLILPIGAWVLREACRAAAGWGEGLRVSVNVSPVQLRDPTFVGEVRQALEESGLSPARLELEITEGIFLEDGEAARKCMAAVRELGVALCIDDFGTGYSSLAYLRRLHVERLKIDRSFVANMHVDDNDAALVRTIVGMGRSLGLGVVAEGVERDAHVDMLREMGCDEMQGFLLGRPESLEDFGGRLHRVSAVRALVPKAEPGS